MGLASYRVEIRANFARARITAVQDIRGCGDTILGSDALDPALAGTMPERCRRPRPLGSDGKLPPVEQVQWRPVRVG
jgi:hypothetical protein